MPAAPNLRVTVLLAVVVGLAVGFLTAYAQGWLGESTNSLANSAGPWALPAFLVALVARRTLPAVLTATIALACSEVGYVIATEVRGGSSAARTIVFWLTAAVLAGPPLGVAAAWSRRDGTWRAVGSAVVPGVLVGEAWYGWTSVADTTDWRYWAVELVIGLVAACSVAVWAARRHPADVAAVVVVAGAAATVVFGAARLAG